MNNLHLCSMCEKRFDSDDMIKSLWACKSCWRWYMAKKRYNISRDAFESLLLSQHGVCAICSGTHSDSLNRRLAIDHDHETGKIRALLCGKCNRGLGYFKHNADTLKRAVNYLTKHKK